jgi:2-methylisocitrate lyase-like PEP mutase family enzyme
MTLAALLAQGRLITAPGVFDMISVRIAESLPFDALYMTGNGTVASYLGLPDAGIATYTDMLNRVRQISELTRKPLIADADTGYGGLLNVHHTIRGYEAAGASGIQIEDQEMPKKCGHTPGRRVVPMAEMVLKIRVAIEARRSAETLIIARTDARAALGLDEAYAAAGADIVFVEAPESVAEVERIAREIACPLLINLPSQGKTPHIPAGRLRELGYRVAIYPGVAFSAAAAAMRIAYTHLLEHGTMTGMPVKMYHETGHGTLNDLMGFGDVHAFEERWSSPD